MTERGPRGLAAALSIVAACSRPSAPDRAEAPAPSVATSVASPAAAETQSARRRPPPPDGCYDGIDPALPARELLAQLADRCAPRTEAVLAEPITVPLRRGAARDVQIVFDRPDKCVRLAAVADRDTELDLLLFDPAGRRVGGDELPGRYALITAHGAVCLADKGTYRVELKADEEVTAVLQAFRAR